MFPARGGMNYKDNLDSQGQECKCALHLPVFFKWQQGHFLFTSNTLLTICAFMYVQYAWDPSAWLQKTCYNTGDRNIENSFDGVRWLLHKKIAIRNHNCGLLLFWNFSLYVEAEYDFSFMCWCKSNLHWTVTIHLPCSIFQHFFSFYTVAHTSF